MKNNKRKSRLGILQLVMCLVLLSLTGCKEKENQTNDFASIEKSKIEIEEIMNLDKENVVLTLDDFDYFFYKEISAVTAISFDVYTIKELEEEDITVSVDTEIPYSYEVVKQEDEKLEDFTLMSYLGVNWKELYQMMVEDENKFQKLASAYSEQYASIGEVPVLHSYNVSLQFNLHEQEFTTETISEIDVVVDGKTCKVDGGSITLDADFTLDREYKGVELESLSYFEVPFDTNREGTTVLPAYSFTATEKLRIADFKVSHPGLDIQSIELQIEENGNVRNEKLTDLNGVEISEGAHVTIYATVQSEKLANVFSYGASGLQIMEYTLLEEDIPQIAYNEFVARTRLRAFDFYGYYIDGIDMLSYYYDYYNPMYGYQQ